MERGCGMIFEAIFTRIGEVLFEALTKPLERASELAPAPVSVLLQLCLFLGVLAAIIGWIADWRNVSWGMSVLLIGGGVALVSYLLVLVVGLWYRL
jgi:hypothetical protein